MVLIVNDTPGSDYQSLYGFILDGVWVDAIKLEVEEVERLADLIRSEIRFAGNTIGTINEWYNSHGRHVRTEIQPVGDVRIVLRIDPNALTQVQEKQLRGISNGRWKNGAQVIRHAY